jgi:TPR repeat protein
VPWLWNDRGVRWLLLVMVAGCAAQTPRAEPHWRAPLARCEAGDETACAVVYREYRGGFPQAYLREPARRAASLSCDRRNAAACRALGWIVDEADRKDAIAKACSVGDTESCADLARAYRTGAPWLGIAADPAIAIAYAIEACTRGDDASCGVPLAIARSGAVEVREDYMRLAFCRHRDASCSVVLADHYAGNTMARDLVDLPRANALLDRACVDGEAVACSRQAALVHRGRGVAADRGRAIDLWNRACDGGDREGCFTLGRAMLVRGERYDLARAVAAFRSSCGEDAACLASAGRILAIKRERDAAAVQLERACALGSERACIDRGRVLVLARRRTNPHVADLERACDGGERVACYAIADVYRRGLGARVDARRAARYAKRASSLRLSSRYWAALRRASDGKGDTADEALLAASVGFVAPLVIMGLFSINGDRWDFSEATYSDP